MTARLIQGVHFPNEQTWEMMRAAGCPDPVLAALKEFPETWESMFAGMIFPDPLSTTGNLIGRMRDQSGEAILYDVVVSREEARFMKKSLGAGKYASIHYHLRREGSLWVGECRGLVIGRVAVRCVITVVPEGLFRPDSPPAKKVAHRKR
jgi:hypothetical protein